MRTYAYATLPLVTEWTGEIKDTKVHVTNRPSDDERCCGRTSGQGWSMYTGSCNSKGKYVHESVLVDVVKDGETTSDVRTVRFCGTHDPVRRSEKKRDEYIAERKRADADQRRRDEAQKRVNDLVREINELAGGKVVESSWSSYGPMVSLYSPQSLLDALRTLTGQEERIAS
jgi:hypothetical protein